MLSALALAAAVAAPNLVLVSIDTLRADRLGCYGYAPAETPASDRLAREGVLVEDATVQVPQTRPSHASLLTGLYPYEHGVRDNFSPPLRRDVPTLATLLKDRGYATGAFVGGFPLAATSGLDRGFDRYDDAFGAAGAAAPLLTERRGSEVVDRALAWLETRGAGPFFAFVHLYDPHSPYEPPAPWARRHAGQPYDGEVAYADAQVGRLLEWLDARSLRGRTLVVLTSDHGEGLGEHGEDEHLVFLYDSTLRVPLVLSWPGVLPVATRIEGQFRSVDLVPTLLELVGAPAARTSGSSRAAELRTGRRLPDNESYAESLYGQLHFGWAPLRALRAEGWKYVDAPRAELYQVSRDPGERENLMDLRGQVASRMRERLRALDTGEAAPALDLPADAGALERMVALGYVGGGASGRGVSGADPKDTIAEHQAYTRDVQKAVRLARAGDVDAALPILERLARRESVSFEVQYFLGRALVRRGRYAEAVAALEQARTLLPSFPALYVDLAQAFRLQGRLKEARAVVDHGLGLAEQSAALWEEGGLVALAMGDTPAARAALERARTLDPDSVRARLALSSLYRDAGQREAAIAEVREATRRAPRSASAWNALGVLLAEAGDREQAEAALRQGLAQTPDDPDLLLNLGEQLLAAGRAAEALPLLQRLVAVAPGFAEGRAALARAQRALAPPPPGALRLSLIRVVDRATAESVRGRLAAGGDFATEARAVSLDASAAEGGSLGVVRLEDLVEPLRSAAAALAPGALSPVLETPNGFVLLRRQ